MALTNTVFNNIKFTCVTGMQVLQIIITGYKVSGTRASSSLCGEYTGDRWNPLHKWAVKRTFDVMTHLIMMLD